MGIVDILRDAGWKPEASTDGEWQPYKGVYKVSVTTLRKETIKEEGQPEVSFYQIEADITESLSGDAKRDSKFPAFRRRFYLDGDKAAENLKKLLNILFTWGIPFDTSSDDALEASFAEAIGKEGYVRAWGWTPEGKEAAQQSWVALKSGVAEKRRGKDSLAF